jgi:hypothetical protein
MVTSIQNMLAQAACYSQMLATTNKTWCNNPQYTTYNLTTTKMSTLHLRTLSLETGISRYITHQVQFTLNFILLGWALKI